MSNSIVNSNNDGSDIIKEEIAQLRALLDEGGLHSGVLEGKYLNQVKRARQLGVQLESEKTYSQKLEKQLASLEAELQRVNSLKEGLGISPPKAGAGGGGGRGSKQTENGLEGEENSGEQQNVITSLKERLERVYVQLNESKLQLEEQKKETQRLRKVLLQEVGGTPQELDTLLKNASEGVGWRGRAQQIVVLKGKIKELERQLATVEQNALNMNNDDQDSAQRQRVGGAISTSSDVVSNAAGRTTTTSINTTNTRKPLLSGGRGRDLDDVARDRVVEVQNRRLLQQRELQEVLERRTAELEEQRRRVEAAQARYINLESDNRTLRDYLHTVLEKTENDNALIDAYREEIEELRQALRAARVKLQEWELWESKATPGGGEQQQQANKRNNNNKNININSDNNNSGVGGLDTNTAVALAGADAAIELNRLKIENMELRSKVEFWEAHAGTINNNNNNNNNNTTGGQNPRTAVNDDTALVLHWLRSVAPSAEGDETTTNTKTKTTAKSSTGSNSVEHSAEWQRRVADVLRRAHAAVRFLEQQREEEGNRLSRCYAVIQRLEEEKKRGGGKVVKTKKGKVETHPSSHDGNHTDVIVNSNNNNNDMNSGGGNGDDDDAAKLTSVVLQENRALKQRLKMMQELMEKERLAYESLRAASDVSIIPTRTTTTTAAATEGESGSVSAAVYQQLRRQYEELRLAFNSLQKENLKRGAD